MRWISQLNVCLCMAHPSECIIPKNKTNAEIQLNFISFHLSAFFTLSYTGIHDYCLTRFLIGDIIATENNFPLTKCNHNCNLTQIYPPPHPKKKLYLIMSYNIMQTTHPWFFGKLPSPYISNGSYIQQIHLIILVDPA